MEKNIREQFQQYFGKQALLAAAPGRVNLIGEHTDYNEGFVLPGAIDKRIYVAIAKNNTNLLQVYANQYQEKFSFSLDAIQPVKGWATYLLGMIFYLQKKNNISGIDVLIDGDVPVGAGMSSSAAICSAFGFALNELFDLGLARMELALTGQKTEHHFANVKCGIMDQFASLHGKAGHLMKLDCRSMEYEYVPFHFPEYKIVLVNTMVSHSLAGSEYNIRRQQCEAGVAILNNYYSGSINSLRDVNIEQLNEHKKDLPDVVYKRCSFVIQENDRLLKGCELLSAHDLIAFGQLMFQAHEGLSKWYEVSCKESDFLVERASTFSGVAGARQMGGGFGGCTINIVKDNVVEDFATYIQEAYQKKFHKVPEIYIMQIQDGAKLIAP